MSVYVKAFTSICLLTYFTLTCEGNDGGWSDTYRHQDNLGKYSFGYKIIDKHGAKQSREEHGDPWTKVGRYLIHDLDGRQRYVSYYADKFGFRAKIDTNEPGTANVDSANAIYNGLDQNGLSETHVPSGNDGHQSSHHSESYGNDEENYSEHDAHASNYISRNIHNTHPQYNAFKESMQYVQVVEQPNARVN